MMGTAVLCAQQPATQGPATASTVGPKIQFESTMHDLGRAMQGEKVKYTYIFTNTGDEVLEVSGVHACGCITIGDYTKKLEPNKTGSIPISFNSSGYAGTVNKSINVTCNDKNNSRPVLQFKCDVWKALEVNPQFTILNVQPDSPQASSTVHIVNHMEEPVTISEPTSDNQSFGAELKTITPGKEFKVVVSAVPPFTARNIHGQITLKTSMASMPVINITAYANVLPAIEVVPPSVALPPTPLASELKRTVSIINKGTKVMMLSEPTLNASGVDVQLNEVQAGRRYEATLTFPAGFTVAQGQRMELAIKSNFSNVPVVKVAIAQTPVRTMPPGGPVKMTPGPAPRLPALPPQSAASQ